MKKLFTGLSALLVLFFSSGCSQKKDSILEPKKKVNVHCVGHSPMAKDMEDIYIFPTEYEKLSCKQIKEETIKVNQEIDKLSDEKVKEITAGMLVILFSGGMFGPDVSEHSMKTLRKEEYESLKKLAIEKNCVFADDM